MATVKYVLGAGGCYRDGRKYLEGEVVEVDEKEKPGKFWRKLVAQMVPQLVEETPVAPAPVAPVTPATHENKPKRPSDKGVF